MKNKKNIKNTKTIMFAIISLLIVSIFLIPTKAYADDEYILDKKIVQKWSGIKVSDEENVEAYLLEEGNDYVLYIKGTGENGKGRMTDFLSISQTPWNVYRQKIVKVIIEDGIENIGSLSFHNFSSVKEIIIPDSVTVIGMSSIAFCTSLKTIKIPNTIKTIDRQAFLESRGMEKITIPKGITQIGDEAFNTRCKADNRPDTIVYYYEDCIPMVNYIFGVGDDEDDDDYIKPHYREADFRPIRPESIAIQNKEELDNKIYKIGSELDLSDIKITVTYNNGDVVYDVTDFTANPSNGTTLNTLGEQTIEIEYEGLTDSLNIEVVEKIATEIEIIQAPNTTEYYTGESLDLTGLQIKVTYEDGSTEIIDKDFEENGFTISIPEGTQLDEEGTLKINVTYQRNNKDDFEIKVQEKKEKDVTPKTGTTDVISYILGLMFISIVGLIMLKK